MSPYLSNFYDRIDINYEILLHIVQCYQNKKIPLYKSGILQRDNSRLYNVSLKLVQPELYLQLL